jgi:hypothetical protein
MIMIITMTTIIAILMGRNIITTITMGMITGIITIPIRTPIIRSGLGA